HTQNTNCVNNPPTGGAASQSDILKRASSTATVIHDAGHSPVVLPPFAVDRGSIVHDSVSVTTNDPSPSQGTPSGTVTLAFSSNGGGQGSATATSGPLRLGANGPGDATGFPQGPLDPGSYGFVAPYSGDGTYAASPGACEPLTVVDANIQLTP